MTNFRNSIKENMFFLGIAGQFVPYILFTGLLMVFSFGNITDSARRAFQPVIENISCISDINNRYITIQQSSDNSPKNITHNKYYSFFYISLSKNSSDIAFKTDNNRIKIPNFLLYASLYTGYYSGLAPPFTKI